MLKFSLVDDAIDRRVHVMTHSTSTSDPVDPIATVASEAPEFALEDVRRLLHEHYGLDGELRALVSERDQNIRVTLPSKERYVLKIANAAEDPGRPFGAGQRSIARAGLAPTKGLAASEPYQHGLKRFLLAQGSCRRGFPGQT